MQTVKVAIIDDHPMLLRGLQSMLEDNPSIDVIGTYSAGKDLLHELKVKNPDVLILDIQMPDQSGEDLAGILQKKYPEVKIIVFTNFEDQYYIRSMIQRGVKGYVLKNSSESVLLNAIHTVSEGKEYYDTAIKPQVVMARKEEYHTGPKKPTLSEREKEILQLLVRNLTSQEIAEKLFISKRTVDFHRANLLLKLDAKNTSNLITLALKMGLVK